MQILNILSIHLPDKEIHYKMTVFGSICQTYKPSTWKLYWSDKKYEPCQRPTPKIPLTVANLCQKSGLKCTPGTGSSNESVTMMPVAKTEALAAVDKCRK